MNLVDSSGWLAYLADEPNASSFEAVLNDRDRLLVPTIVIAEVMRVSFREADEGAAVSAYEAMLGGHVVGLTPDLSVEAARLAKALQLPLADSIIAATASAHSAEVWTEDAHFVGLPRVRYFPERPR